MLSGNGLHRDLCTGFEHGTTRIDGDIDPRMACAGMAQGPLGKV